MDTLRDERGIGRRLKRALPTSAFRVLTVLYNALLSVIPSRIKYPLGTWLRKRKMPYSLIDDGDVVVQVGAARDVLKAGRCRAVHFARLVGRGKAVVVEADPDNARALEGFVARQGLADRVIIFGCGAWSEKTDLVLLSSPTHPAATLVEGASEVERDVAEARAYHRVTIQVDTIDRLLREAGVAGPKIVSITTNGAEIQILEGMAETIASGLPYICLALPGRNQTYLERLDELGYVPVAEDDRGLTFQRRGGAAPGSEAPADASGRP